MSRHHGRALETPSMTREDVRAARAAIEDGLALLNWPWCLELASRELSLLIDLLVSWEEAL